MSERVLSKFKSNLLSFLDELINQFPQEGDLVIMRLFISNQIPIKDVMDIFIYNINKNDQQLRKMVKDRDEVFFLEHNIFDNLGRDKVSHFKRLWRSGKLDKEDKEIIWDWIDAFILISDEYAKVL